MPRAIPLAEVIQSAIDSAFREKVHTLPGIVTAWHPDTQCVDVQLATTEPLISLTDGSVTYEIPAQVPAAKVAFPGANGFTISWPLAVGSHVTCYFFDLYVEDYRQSGQQSNPTLIGKHTGYSCIVGPWSCADSTVIADATAANGAMVIGKDGDPGQIRLSPGVVQLGRTGADFVVLANKLIAKFNAHTHPAPGGATSAPTTPLAAADVGSALVKAD